MAETASPTTDGKTHPAVAQVAGGRSPHSEAHARGRQHPQGPPPAPRAQSDFFAEIGADPLRSAFSGRRPVHPFVGLSPVPEDATTEIWRRLSATPRSRPSVAYVHIPFCFNHCQYCGFYQNAWHAEDGPAYVDSLIEQLRRGRDLPMHASGPPIRALYFGGGTPTLLAAADLARLIEAARTHLPLARDCEITVEGRIHGFGADKADAAFGAGANRLSLGVQTFDETVRRRMGRLCSRRELVSTLEQLLHADQGAIIIDLIFGLPGQDAAVWAADLEQAVALGLDGIDLYALKPVPSSPLARAVDNGRLPAPSQASQAEQYRSGSERLHRARWEALSCTHWRRTTRERNLYNLLVKSGADCLAIGAGAGGSMNGADAGFSFRNVAAVDEYRGRVASGAPVVAGLMRQSPHRRLFNRIKGELEQGRLDTAVAAAALRRDAGLDWQALAEPLLAQWQAAGLLTRDGDWAELTLAGRFWQVQLTLNLLEWLNQALMRGGR
ncbi:heme anaerobic degradation radical SAM methyltransferase ChuW/HutW [Thiohalocapsa sp. ML1]|uniref:heme anaerobic degradation radical SAM methyltransferase ChuW/HutW n=1 Tax=Thiohalocapsa sp. ML1 TaxID=1431688 RepID=UPI0009EA9D11|nr:heme anaerobic degradation radical SAM methyltransferase ChuW/HutW [Thiohalocapsa sp. ML1]